MTKADLIRMQIRACLGLPYIWGGNNPLKGYDCSGFVVELLKSVGFWPSRTDATSQQLADHFLALSGNTPAQFGSLLFFGKSLKQVTHVAMALSRDEMVEASGGDGSVVTLEQAKKKDAYVKIRPIKTRSDLVGVHHLGGL